MQSLGTRLMYTEQCCISNIITIYDHLGSNTVMPCMYVYKPESQRVPQECTWQLAAKPYG